MTASVFTNLLLPLTTPLAWREKLEIEDVTLTSLGVSVFMQTLLDDTTATAALATLGIVASAYSPTLFNTANLDASTAFATAYVRVGSTAVVAGVFHADATAAGSTSTTLGMSLPVASNFAGSTDLGGVAQAFGGSPARVYADSTNDRAIFEWTSLFTTNTVFTFIFGYRVM